ncbi:unnamed protein product [Staurois parvus]|uniref:Uncharacterized protein n=1 Tax=Staurois parvus TaxID=386267 RepID=A0ABN9C8J2_9NEOB|nr:unnamed protein product [Staurois parvus]
MRLVPLKNLTIAKEFAVRNRTTPSPPFLRPFSPCSGQCLVF